MRYMQRMQYCSAQPDYAAMLADWARIELLKEKVKERMNAKYGEKLDKMADLIVDIISQEHESSEKFEDSREELYEEYESMF